MIALETHKRTIVLFYKSIGSVGGAEILCARHYEWLQSKGHIVKLVSFNFEELDRINIDSSDVIQIKGSGAVGKIFQLAKILKHLNPSEIYCHSGYIDLGLSCKLAGLDYSVFVHQPTTMSYNESDKHAFWIFPKYKNFARKDLMYNAILDQHKALTFIEKIYVNIRGALSQWVLRGAQNRFVLSDYAVHEKKSIFGLDAVRLSGALLESELAELEARSPLAPCSGKINLVTISRLDKNKRINILIDAVKIIREQGNDVSLMIGGTGPAESELKEYVMANDLEEGISFIGYVPEREISDIYENMDLFVTIDWADFRITTYEVLSHNRRVLVSDDTDIDEDLVHSGYLFVSPANAKDLAGTIKQALDSRVTWSQSQLREYLQNFTWETYFQKIDQVNAGS